MAVFLVFSIIFVVLFLIYQFSKRKFNYWEKQNVPHPKPTPILGNYGDYILIKKFIGHVVQDICEKFPNEPYIGAFYGTEPTLIVQDPELIKLITTKDFYYFNSRETAEYSDKEVMMNTISFASGDRWRIIRQNFTPLFSTAKMKNMFYKITNCAHVLEGLIDETTSATSELEIRDVMIRFTMDSIGSCAFGVETRAMEDTPNNTFRKMGNLFFENSNIRAYALITKSIWPAIFYGIGLKVFPDALYNFFRKLLVEVFQSRNYEPSPRNDFVDLTLSMKKNTHITGDSIKSLKTGVVEKVSLKVDDELMAAQCIIFFAAGFETSATTSSFTLYELAKNQEAQARAIAEVDEYLKNHGNQLDYGCMTELPYLLACIEEALRLYPVLSVLTREVVEDYVLPSGLRLEKGMRIHIPVYFLHQNPDYFPQPDVYNPDRFFGENRHDVKPYTYLPFGEGPRICIGMRFAKMQMLAGLVTIFKKYRLELVRGMSKEVVFEPRSIVTQAIGGIRLNFIARDGWETRVFKK